MFQFVVLFVALAGVATRGTILETSTTSVMQRYELLLTKMYLRSKGTALFFMGEIIDEKTVVDQLSLAEENSMWLVVVPRSKVYFRLAACQEYLYKAENKVVASYSQPVNLTLNITAEDTYVAMLIYCPSEEGVLLKPRRLAVSMDLFEGGSHLYWHEKWQAAIHLLRFALMLYILVSWEIPYKEDSLAYGPLLMSMCNLLYAGFGMLHIFYHKLAGHDFLFISDLPQFFRIDAEQIFLFFVVAISIGWRSSTSTGHIPDAVAPFVICNGMLQLMMHILVANSPETIFIDRYDQTIYGDIYNWSTLVLLVIFLVVHKLLPRRQPVINRPSFELVNIGCIRGLLQFLRSQAPISYISLLLQIAEVLLTCLFMHILLRYFLNVDVRKLAKQKLRQRLYETEPAGSKND